jgi:bifunctional DNA-binding transcriptional regulator/antitoxin component of YhaV-PrlF toxin-antitoxin module
MMNLGNMAAVISINKRGTLTLPKEFWMQLGLQSSGRVVAQETKRGILLRAETVPAPKTYSKAKVARIAKAEAELAPFADDMRASLLKARTRRK